MPRLVKSALVFIGVILLAACSSGQERPTPTAPVAESPAVITPAIDKSNPVLAPESAPIRIALLLPLSGPAQAVGEALRDAAALALFDAYDPRLVLMPIDTKGTTAGAKEAAETAIRNQASLILGPLLADSVTAAAPLLQEAGLPLIGFSNNRNAAGPSVYLMGFMPDQEVVRITRYAIEQGHTRLAAIAPLSAYGDRVLQGFAPTVVRSGGDVISLVRYEPDPGQLNEPVKNLARYDARRAAYLEEVKALEALDDDLSQMLLKELEVQETIGDVGFDALLIAEGDPLVRSLGPLLPYYEIDPDKVQFLGTGLWDEPTLGREPPLNGGWFPAPAPDAPRAFLKRFEDIYGHPAPRIATLAYDAMALAATLARNPVRAERFSRTAIESPSGFNGIDGPFRFHFNGMSERLLSILQVEKNGFKVIDPAPAGFTPDKVSALSKVSPVGAP